MWWSFEANEGDAIPDASGNGFTAACVGAAQFARGRSGRALKLDGKTYLRVEGGGAFNPKSLTIAAWINPEKVNARRGIVVKRTGNTEAPFVFGLSEGALRFEGLGTSGSFWPFNFSGPPVAADRWTHVAVTVEGGKRLTLFVDGKPAAMKDITEDPKPNNEPIVIGREAWGGEEGPQAAAFFQGLMDEVKLWKRALTPEEVAAEAGG